MGEYSLTLRVSMYKGFLLLGITLVSADWTCEDCSVAAPSLGEYCTSPAAIQFQSTVLVKEFCAQSENMEKCRDHLPDMWRALAVIILPTHYKYICGDIECDLFSALTAGLQLRRPNCEECTGRVNLLTDHLGHENTVTAWVFGLLGSDFCTSFSSGHEEWTEDKCREVIYMFIPKALPFLSSIDRSWVHDWCREFESC